MKNNKVNQNGALKESKELALHYMETLVAVARESFLILDRDLRVISANPTFYQNFRVFPEQTEGKTLYELGNGQWNIPELKKLLEDILPNQKVVKDYEVSHDFETIGQKIILLNARQIDTVQLIILAMEDVTNKAMLEHKLTDYNQEIEAKLDEKTVELSSRIKELEAINKSMVGRELKMVELKKEIEDLKKRVKSGNGNNRNGINKNGSNGHANNGHKTLA